MEALYHHDVQKRFKDRLFFVRCEGARSSDALMATIAKKLGISLGSGLKVESIQANESSVFVNLMENIQAIESSVFANLRQTPAVLVLDNAETPYDADTRASRDASRTCREIRGLALVVTLRGDSSRRRRTGAKSSIWSRSNWRMPERLSSTSPAG